MVINVALHRHTFILTHLHHPERMIQKFYILFIQSVCKYFYIVYLHSYSLNMLMSLHLPTQLWHQQHRPFCSLNLVSFHRSLERRHKCLYAVQQGKFSQLQGIYPKFSSGSLGLSLC